MVHVYKKSASPLRPWDVMRTAGKNNVAPRHNGKFLVLWNADVVRRDGCWHYVFDFDGRNTLEKNEIAVLMSGAGESTTYADDTDWQTFLGADYEVVTEARRKQILSRTDGPHDGEVKITCMRVGSSSFALPLSA
jgi:hypothetical protein